VPLSEKSSPRLVSQAGYGPAVNHYNSEKHSLKNAMLLCFIR